MDESIYDVLSQDEEGKFMDDKGNPLVKIGVGFKNKDDSFNIILDSVPLNGKLHLRKRRERK